jgi:predicted DNA-binding protein (MmcQ/YjbR family)
VREAYSKVATKILVDQIGSTIEIEPPTETLPPDEFDPLAAERPQAVLADLREICLGLPETVETTQFGRPAWKAGKKTFATAHRYQGRMGIQFWVGTDRQATLTFDDHFKVPAYTGHNGWIELDVEDEANWEEIEELALFSYRHFALKRMLKELDGPDI